MATIARTPHFLHPTGLVAPYCPRPSQRDNNTLRWQIETAQQLLRLEADYFPETVAHSAAGLDIESQQSIHRYCMRFASRFNAHYFPIEIDMMVEGLDEMEEIGESAPWLTYVPVMVFGVAYDCEHHLPYGTSADDIEQMVAPDYIFIEDDVLDLLMCLAYPELYGDGDVAASVRERYTYTRYSYLAWAYPALPLPDSAFALDGLADVLRQMLLEPPLTYLADAVELVLGECGNCFLDWSEQDMAESGMTLYWSNTAEMHTLAAIWQHAAVVLEDVRALNRWCFDGEGVPENPLSADEQMMQRYRQIMQTLEAAWRMKAGQMRFDF